MAERHRMASLVVPARWDDVTPEWMTAALSALHPDARVAEVEVLLREPAHPGWHDVIVVTIWKAVD